MRKRIISVLACGILAMGATFAGAGVLKSEAEEEHGASVPCSAIQLFDTLTEEKVTNETLGVSGVTFNGYGDTWSVNFNGVFTGNTEIEYAFPAAVTGLWNNVDLFDFVVKQTDGTEFFTVRKGIPWLDAQDKWQNTIQLFIGDTAYSAKMNSATPYFSGKQAGTLYIESETEGTAIYYTNDAGAKTLLGKFDGVSTYNSVTLPKIELPETGYKIELKNSMNKSGHTTINTAPLITKINGISVVDGEVNMKSLFTKGAVFSSVNDISGYQLNGNTSAAWNNSLSQVFTGDFNLEYAIGSQNTREGGFKIIFESLDGTELFTLKKFQNYNDTPEQGWNNVIKVSVGEKSYKSADSARPYINSTQVGNIAVKQTESGIQIGYSGDTEQKILATFDGNNDMPEIHLPEQGYSVRFESANNGMPPLITKINGKVCTGIVEDKAADFSVDISAAGESVNESGVAALNLKRGANPFTATVKNAKFAGITLNEYTKSVDISSLDLSADKTAEISYLGVTKEYAVNVYDYVVTLKDGEAETKQYLETTETVSFVAGAQSDKIFIGYANGSNLYGVNSAYTPTEDIIFNAAYIDFSMHTGASVRKQTDENNQYGMRFLAGIAETDLETYGGFITETGVLILPEDLRAGKEITLDNFSAENKEILKIANEGNEFAKGVNVTNFEGYGVYTGVITSILPANINRKFSARGYAVIKYSDNTTAIIYTAFGVENNSRSAYEVAKAAKEAGETGAALDYYISAVDGNN